MNIGKRTKTKRKDRAQNAREIGLSSFPSHKANKTKLLGKPVFVSRIFGKQPSAQEVKRIVSRVSKAGVLVPELVGYSSGSEIPRYVTQKLGKRRADAYPAERANTLRTFLFRFQEPNPLPVTYLRQVRKLISSAARSLGTIHSLEISHGHAHFNNFVPVKSRVAVIDFKLAEERKVDWSSSHDVYNAFYSDYAHLTHEIGLRIAMASPENALKLRELGDFFIKKMVEKYPMQQSEKQKLVRRLTREI
jgi:tRNA A-37 threonylcarbamoyl transferase component Bud32